jgi:N-acylneuraminate cytidylyltransferase
MKAPRGDIALIPARQGSERLPGKNVKLLNGIPLIAYTIQAAVKSNIFSEVIVSTDSVEIAEIAQDWGARVPSLRPSKYAGSLSPDLEWVTHAIDHLVDSNKHEIECVAILRPTSPLRLPTTIKNAMHTFKQNSWADSLRAMEVTHIHPGKMWRVNDEMEARPYLDQSNLETPTHNLPTQSLEKLWVQNASLEITRLTSLIQTKSISGKRVMGFQMPGLEGFDVNSPTDWKFLEFLVREQPEMIPELEPLVLRKQK